MGLVLVEVVEFDDVLVLEEGLYLDLPVQVLSFLFGVLVRY